MTGSWYFSARAKANAVTRKQSETDIGASTTLVASPCEPYRASRRSDCSVLVGIPVLGPPLCESTMTAGISAIERRPMVSDMSDSPGPDVDVMLLPPAHDAPATLQIADISSSVWRTMPPSLGRWTASHSMISEAGVMG